MHSNIQGFEFKRNHYEIFKNVKSLESTVRDLRSAVNTSIEQKNSQIKVCMKRNVELA